MKENKIFDKKSIRFLRNSEDNYKHVKWDDLAKDCVCFANAQGGFIYIGIEDNDHIPPNKQKIDDRDLPDIIQKNIIQRTIHVGIIATIEIAENQSEYIQVQVFRNNQMIASTTDGKYYIRVHDQCKPIPPDEMVRLAADKNTFVWETQITKQIPSSQFDVQKRTTFLIEIRNSPRISSFTKEMSDDELLRHYFFQYNGYLTNLGILWIGTRNDRALLLYPPTIQVIRYNDRDEKVWKLSSDDYFSNPKELLEKILRDVPDWQESIEIPDGMFRKHIPCFPIEVVRELVVNALVHRTYTTRGDIFIYIYPDRMEIYSPGRLPFGVTPKNILSQSIRRNEHLSKVFYDLGLMENEGSGFDLVYVTLLSLGKPLPIVKETGDRVIIIVKKQFVNQEVLRLMNKANNEFSLKQKEIISLGLLAQQSYTASEISAILNQDDEEGLKNWLGKLLDYKLVIKKGKNKGTEYSINPEFMRQINFKGKTNLKDIEDHRLEELILKDVAAYPESGFSAIHSRIGIEINKHKVRRIIKKMLEYGTLRSNGKNKQTTYSIEQNPLKNQYHSIET